MNSLLELICDLADCADILVFDWSLHNDDGAKAMEIIASILRQDESRSLGRLRLFAIYTGNPAIAKIPTTIKEHIERNLLIPLEQNPDGFVLSYGATRIVILAKPEPTKIPSEYHHRIVEFDKLVESLTDEFTLMTAGLVSNVVVSAFSNIRKNTYRILNRFSNNLDSPYLSHRFMSPEPLDAESYITGLVAEELHALLEEANVGEQAGLKSIRAWLRVQGFSGITLDASSNISPEDVLVILEKGLQEFSGLSEDKKEKLERRLHKLPLSEQFRSLVPGNAESPDERFAHLTLMLSHYDGRVPVLTLGTILKQLGVENPRYLVCVQPRCDCVRITGKQNFPFLPLTRNESRFDTILIDDDKYVRLLISRKPYDLVLIPFKPSGNDPGVVLASRVNGECHFEDANTCPYEWMGTLRGDHALRLSNEFSSTIGRVGLDESEWLRRWAAKR